jgi:hypothetical protein
MAAVGSTIANPAPPHLSPFSCAHRLRLGIAQLTRFFPCLSVAESALLDDKTSRRPPLPVAGMANRRNHRRLLYG